MHHLAKKGPLSWLWLSFLLFLSVCSVFCYSAPDPIPNPVFAFGDWVMVHASGGITSAKSSTDEWEFIGTLPKETHLEYYTQSAFDIAYGAGYWAMIVGGFLNEVNKSPLRIAPDPQGAFYPSRGTQGGRNLKYGGRDWVMVGLHRCKIATTGNITGAWQIIALGDAVCTASHLYAVNYGENHWVAVGMNGTNGTLLTASDPRGPWKLPSFPTTGIFYDVAYGNGQWVVVGENGTILTATDPAGAWSQVSSSTTSHLFGVVYGNGQWVAVGGDGLASKCVLCTGDEELVPTILTTREPTSVWSQAEPEETDNVFLDVEYGDGLWVAVGDRGAVATGNPAGVWEPVPSAGGVAVEYRSD